MTVDGKTIAQRTAALFGGTPRVHRYVGDSRSISVNILSAVDGPTPGVTSYGTVDLSTFDNRLTTADGRALQVEILGACDSEVATFGNILMASALNVASGEYSLSPGAVHPRCVELYEPDVSMKHLFFVTPFLWGEEVFTPLEDAEAVVAFLQAVPISDAEFDLLRKEGPEALEARFEHAQIDVYDLDRPSVA